jgi:aryl-alcohol dehydrogenase-like predicted oxidoreductase
MEVLPAAEDYGIGVIAWSPLQSGLLGGVLAKQGEGARRLEETAQSTLRDKREQVQAYEALCAELGEEPATVALAWLLTRRGVTGPIVGPRTLEQLQGSLRSLDLAEQLGDETLGRLDTIFPPHKPAPEDYAW